MNAIFTIILTLSILVTTIFSPSSVIPSFSTAGSKAITLSTSLLAVYGIWLGFTNLLNESKLSDKISNLLKPVIRKLFKTDNKKAINEISINLSANLLGLGGVATPSGINAMSLLDADGNEYAKNMLFVITATSIQIFPLTVMALASQFGSATPHQIFLPTLLTTAVSTGAGILLTSVFK